MAAPAKKAKATASTAPTSPAPPTKQRLPWRSIWLLAAAFGAAALASILAPMSIANQSDPDKVLIRVVAGVLVLLGLFVFALGYAGPRRLRGDLVAYGGASLVAMAAYANTVQEPWFAIPGLLLGLVGLLLDLAPETKMGFAFLLALSCVALVQGTGAETGLGNIGLTCLLGVLLLLWAALPEGRWRSGPTMLGLIATGLLVVADIYLLATGFTVQRLILLPIAAVLCLLFFLLRFSSKASTVRLPVVGRSVRGRAA